MRERHVKTPVLLLTARDGRDDRVRGLALAPMITWSNLLRFLSYLPASAPCCADPIANRKPIPHGRRMDVAQREVRRDGQRIELSPREFAARDAVSTP